LIDDKTLKDFDRNPNGGFILNESKLTEYIYENLIEELDLEKEISSISNREMS